MTTATLTKKRKYDGYYLVDASCSACKRTTTVGFSGWSALLCACGEVMERTPYKGQK